MKIEMIAHGDIAPNADQPRKHFDEGALADLAKSITASGLLQPITVRYVKTTARRKGGFEIVAGERRWRACGLAGVASVACIVRDIDDREAFIIATMENVARADMNPIEEADALRRLLDLPMTPQEIEERIGMVANIVTWKASLTRCIDTVKHLVARGQFPVAQAISLSRLSPNGQQLALREYQRRRLTVLEFTETVNAIYARENNMEMFAETKVSQAQRAAADRFRSELKHVAGGAAAIESLDIDALAPAMSHELGAVVQQIEEAAKVLQRARTKLLRAKGRGQAAQLLGVAAGE